MFFEQRELVLLPYLFTDKEGSKVRPAIIISNNDFNKKCQDCVMVPLTTVIKDELFSLIINQDCMETGKLLKESRIRIDKLFTVNKKLIIMKIGKINSKTFDKIRLEIEKIF